MREPEAPTAWDPPPAGLLKLNLGCGPTILAGWQNLDQHPPPGALDWDALEPMRYEAGSVGLIYSEHFIEHIPLDKALRLLSECHALLRPGGVLRLSTPDLRMIIDTYLEGPLDRWRNVGWVPATLCDLMNEGMRAWGHQYVYDEEQLVWCLHAAGFARVAKAPWRQSTVPDLAGRETRPFNGELIFEAQKGLPLSSI